MHTPECTRGGSRAGLEPINEQRVSPANGGAIPPDMLQALSQLGARSPQARLGGVPGFEAVSRRGTRVHMPRRACCPPHLSCVAVRAAMQERHESPAPTTLAQAQQQAADMQSLAALQQLAQNGAGSPAIGHCCSAVTLLPALQVKRCALPRPCAVLTRTTTKLPRGHKLTAHALLWRPLTPCCLLSGALARAASATPPPHSHTPPLPPHTPPVQGASPGAPPGHAQALAANAAAMAAAAASGMGLPPAGMHPGGGGMNGGVVNTLEYQAAYQARPRLRGRCLSLVKARSSAWPAAPGCATPLSVRGELSRWSGPYV